MATEEQLLSDNTTQFRTFATVEYGRVGQRLTPANRMIQKISFLLWKSGSPSGNVTYTIRRVSDDGLLASQVLKTADSLQVSATWEELTFTTPVLCNEEVRMSAECPASAYPDFANIEFQGSDVKADEVYSSYDEDVSALWTDRNDRDLAYIYTYIDGTPSTVTTQGVTNISGTTATGNGNITSIGNNNPTAHGVCWNTTGTPTTSDSKTDEGATSSTGAFTTSMTGLTAGTKYYVSAYVTAGTTAYGSEVVFWADKGTAYPSDALTRVTGLVHRYSPGNYSLEVFMGDTKTDWGTMKPEETAKSAPTLEPPPVPKTVMIPETPISPAITEPFTTTTPTEAEMGKYAGMSQSVYNKIIKQGATLEALRAFGPINTPEDLESFKKLNPTLGIGKGIPKIGTPEYTDWVLGQKK